MSFAVQYVKNRKGRKRKSTKTISAAVPRYDNGKCKDESPAQIRATGLIQRLKLGAPLQDAFDAKWGSTLGQMRLRGIAFESTDRKGQRDPASIDQTQFDTAERYQKLIFAYRRIMGLGRLVPQSASLMERIGGIWSTDEPDEKTISDIRRRHSDARRQLLDTGMTYGIGSRINWIVYEICILDRAIDMILPDDFGNFKLGINALGRVV